MTLPKQSEPRPEATPDLGRRLRRARRRAMFLGLRTILRVVGFERVWIVGRLAG